MQSFGGFFEAYYYHNYLRLPPDTAAQITVDFSVKPNKRGLRLSFRGGICAFTGWSSVYCQTYFSRRGPQFAKKYLL